MTATEESIDCKHNNELKLWYVSLQMEKLLRNKEMLLSEDQCIEA